MFAINYNALQLLIMYLRKFRNINIVIRAFCSDKRKIRDLQTLKITQVKFKNEDEEKKGFYN